MVDAPLARPLATTDTSRVRHPSARLGTPPGVVVAAPAEATDRDYAYAVSTCNRLRRVPGAPHEDVVLHLRWHVADDHPAEALLRLADATRVSEHRAIGRSFVEALDRLEVTVRIALA